MAGRFELAEAYVSLKAEGVEALAGSLSAVRSSLAGVVELLGGLRGAWSSLLTPLGAAQGSLAAGAGAWGLSTLAGQAREASAGVVASWAEAFEGLNPFAHMETAAGARPATLQWRSSAPQQPPQESAGELAATLQDLTAWRPRNGPARAQGVPWGEMFHQTLSEVASATHDALGEVAHVAFSGLQAHVQGIVSKAESEQLQLLRQDANANQALLELAKGSGIKVNLPAAAWS